MLCRDTAPRLAEGGRRVPTEIRSASKASEHTSATSTRNCSRIEAVLMYLRR